VVSLEVMPAFLPVSSVRSAAGDGAAMSASLNANGLNKKKEAHAGVGFLKNCCCVCRREP
jgi:hypothetical protein